MHTVFRIGDTRCMSLSMTCTVLKNPQRSMHSAGDAKLLTTSKAKTQWDEQARISKAAILTILIAFSYNHAQVQHTGSLQHHRYIPAYKLRKLI